ncbi:MAG: hypothetical protein RJQ04_14365 [Longimicrobiales bacterium]
MRTAWTVAVLVAAAPGVLGAQVQRDGPLVPGDTVQATPRDRYDAGTLHRALFGRGHRSLWATPVPARVLDLDRFAGGLTLEGLGGGNQTRSLRFVGADGRAYNFRSIDKDASRTLEPELRRSAAAWILQDQISSLFPLSAMVVEPLLEAVDVLHPEPELRVMPDDPRLGTYRDEFRGMLGWIEERPDEGPEGTAGFAGSSRVVGSERLWELLEESPEHRIAGRSLLKARFVDVLVGDWDRHPGQWRWARFERDGRFVYEPIPRDRDWSFARIDGAFTLLSWMPWPQYAGFGPDLGSAFRRTWNGQAVDRHLLDELPWPTWEEVVTELVARLDDDVIRAAVARLPDSYRAQIGDELETHLMRRRDQLPAFAREYYELLAGWVDVHTTDVAERVRITGLPGDTVRVEVAARTGEGAFAEAHFRRDFTAPETREVRLDLHGGDDRVEVAGHLTGRIVVRVVGGGGQDVFFDGTSGNAVRFYDEDGGTSAAASASAIDARPWQEPYDPRERTDWVPARDWGARTLPVPVLSRTPDEGMAVGLGLRHEWYGFRRWPYSSALEAGAGVASETGRVQGHLRVDVPLAAHLRARAFAELRGAEVRQFYGFGNDTRGEGDDDLFDAERREVRLGTRVVRGLSPATRLSAGVTYRTLWALDNEGTLVERVRPYGYPDFHQVGLSSSLSWEGPDPGTPLDTPTRLRVEASWFPSLLDVEASFSALDAEASVSVPLAEDALIPPVLAVLVGGRRVWGRYPFHEAALLGGRGTLRGFRNQRFAGDGSLFVNAELRAGIGRIFLLLPGDVGVLGLVDSGRIFHPDGPGDSDRWHTAVGGGLWVSFLGAYSATLSLAHGDEWGAYLTVGFPF